MLEGSRRSMMDVGDSLQFLSWNNGWMHGSKGGMLPARRRSPRVKQQWKQLRTLKTSVIVNLAGRWFQKRNFDGRRLGDWFLQSTESQAYLHLPYSGTDAKNVVSSNRLDADAHNPELAPQTPKLCMYLPLTGRSTHQNVTDPARS